MRLHWGGVGAHNQVGVFYVGAVNAGAVNVEGVLHLASRVVGVEVQRVKVVPFVLNLRAFGNLPTHCHEKVADLIN